ncbi:MAG: ROK family protein [Acidobacteria bacterium]|nr:ROK family protein [Acidobacteriota bacterium]MBI3424964.1 ROK family protein [Acidobacteriota bacterium]
MASQNPPQTTAAKIPPQPGERLGVDLGSHHIRVGVLNQAGQLSDFHRENYATDPLEPRNGPALAAQLRALLQQTLQTHPDLAAIGIAFPGLIQQPAQRILKLDHAPGLTALNLHAELQEALPVPLRFENSANAAAFAEMQTGVARGRQDWLYLHIGANVSAGLILGGQLQRGQSGLAGALGEMAIDPEHTGEFVPLESMVSAENIVRRTERRLQRDSTSSLSRLKLLGGSYTYDNIIEAAVQGDDLSRLMLQRTGKFIGMAIAEVINLLNLSLVAIGGAPAARNFLVPAIAAEAEQRAAEIIFADCQIVAAELGAEASVIGAALLA